MSLLHGPDHNHLLASLATAEIEVLATHLQLVLLRLGDRLYEAGDYLPYAYFPVSAIVSLHYVIESGRSAELSGVGNEGMVGFPLVMGGDVTSSSAMVQTAGYAYRLEGGVLKEAFDRTGAMRKLILLYIQSLIMNMSQNAACNRHHSVDQQLCRWLLVNLDRSRSEAFSITQELMASILGIEVQAIAAAAVRLQQGGVIRYRRAHVTVLERAGLESAVCECYALGRAELLRLLPGRRVDYDGAFSMRGAH